MSELRDMTYDIGRLPFRLALLLWHRPSSSQSDFWNGYCDQRIQTAHSLLRDMPWLRKQVAKELWEYRAEQREKQDAA